MIEIRSPEQLEKWLEDKPKDWAQIIAVRVAMRALPFIGTATEDWLKRCALLLMRANATSWATLSYPAHDMANAATYATAADDAAAYAAYAASANAPAAAADAVWRSVSEDCRWLSEHAKRADAVRVLTGHSLWREQPSVPFDAAWKGLRQKLLTIDTSYAVWIEWFDRRIKGEAAMFDIPGDTDRAEDLQILIRLADATDKGFWDRGAKFVNPTLQGWIDEARARAAPPAPTNTRTTISEKLLESASPQAQITDGKLDAVPNAVFDKPRYSDSLADLPSEMQAFLAVLDRSLQPNCPSIIRNCIKGYSDELLLRGNRPIVNILSAMASAISAQLWIQPDATDRQNPDVWQVRHADEWDAGTVDLFRAFFKHHLDLINHFPMNAEREALIAATPIDEVKASGATLLDPINAVTGLILDLFKEGAATNNIVRIVEAHARYSRDIAGLPTPDQVSASSTTVSPKRRHVLATAGFYLHAYSIVGSTASIASTPQGAALMAQLAIAAQLLLSFIV